MKARIYITILLLAVTAYHAGAQTKKRTKAKTTKTVTTKRTTTAAPASKAQPTHEQTVPQTRVAPAVQTRKAEVSNDYKTAVGLKFIYGIALTGKHFISNKSALEGIVRYRSFSGLGSEFNISALYEYHGDISGVEGLRWYGGGGAFAGFFSFDSDYAGLDETSSTFGPTGVLGLEYKFKKLPLAISADWQPIYLINGNGGFAAESGGLGIKYTF